MEAYEKLLITVSDAKKYSYFHSPLSDYNIFKVLGVQDKEVIMCKFLCDLLSPEGKHDCRILFLKTFLQRVLHMEAVSDIQLWHTSEQTNMKLNSSVELI